MRLFHRDFRKVPLINFDAASTPIEETLGYITVSCAQTLHLDIVRCAGK